MTVQQFYEILGDIDEKFVKDAEIPSNHKNRLWLRVVVAMSACFAIIVGIGMYLRGGEYPYPEFRF